ncbi:MAG: universal stress protein [Myxococcales bacterium]|nr:universal stress protein [Myxococcales bacterium]
MFERIVMMTDLTDTSRRAFAPVAALAKRQRGTRVILVHAVVGSTEQYFLDEMIRKRIDANARKKVVERMQEMAADLGKHGVDVEPVVEVGSPFNVLPDVVQRYDADLVVLPTRTEHSLLRRISNSVTARAIRDHVVPVLTINDHFDPEKWSGFGPVVHPVDFGDQQRSGLKTAEDMAAATDSTIELVHVLRPINIASNYDDDARELARIIDKSQDDLQSRVEGGLAEVLGNVTKVKGECRVLRNDNAGVGIVDHLAACGAGLAVLPALGRDTVHTQLMGSVAEHVIRYAPCPVLVYDRPLAS